jgi:hypothetical protein
MTAIEVAEIRGGAIRGVDVVGIGRDIVRVEVENVGILPARPSGRCVVVDPVSGAEIARAAVNLQRESVLAAKSAPLIGFMNRPLRPGCYLARVTMVFPENVVVSAAVPFVVQGL